MAKFWLPVAWRVLGLAAESVQRVAVRAIMQIREVFKLIF